MRPDAPLEDPVCLLDPELCEFEGGDLCPEAYEATGEEEDAPHGQNPELIDEGDVR